MLKFVKSEKKLIFFRHPKVGCKRTRGYIGCPKGMSWIHEKLKMCKTPSTALKLHPSVTIGNFWNSLSSKLF